MSSVTSDAAVAEHPLIPIWEDIAGYVIVSIAAIYLPSVSGVAGGPTAPTAGRKRRSARTNMTMWPGWYTQRVC